MTIAGGRCLGTFTYEEHALERVYEVLAKRRRVWIHHRPRTPTDMAEETWREFRAS